MGKKEIYLLVMLLTGLPAFAQQADEVSRLIARGHLTLELDRADSARWYFRRVLSLTRDTDPARALIAWRGLSDTWSRRGEFERAARLLDTAWTYAQPRLRPPHLALVYTLTARGISKEDQGAFAEGMMLLQEAEAMARQLPPEQDTVLAEVLERIGINYSYQGDRKQAVQYCRQALGIRMDRLDPCSPRLAKSLNNTGIQFKEMRLFDQAMYCFQTAIDIFLSVPSDLNRMKAGVTLNNIASIYTEMRDDQKGLEAQKKALELIGNSTSGFRKASYEYNLAIKYNNVGDYYQGINYLNRSLEEFLKIGEPARDRIALIYHELGRVNFQQGKLVEARLYIQKALEIKKSILGAGHPDMMTSYDMLALVAQQEGNYEEAENYFLETEKISRNVFGPEYSRAGDSKAYIAEMWIEAGFPERAVPLLREAKDIYLKNYKPHHPDVAWTIGYTAKAYLRLGDQELALWYSQRAIECLLPGHRDTALFTAPPLAEGRWGTSYLGEFIDTRSEVLLNLFRQCPDSVQYLEAAYHWYHTALAVSDSFRRSYRETSSQITLQQQHFYLYEYTIRTAAELWKLKKDPRYAADIFALMEKSKALLLMESLRSGEALRFAGLPQQVLLREDSLRKVLSVAEREAMDATYEEDPGEALRLQARAANLRIEWQALLETLEQRYPRYYQLRYGLKPLSLAEVQARMKPDEAILSYFTGDSLWFCMTLRKNGAELTQGNAVQLIGDLSLFRNETRSDAPDKASFKAIISRIASYVMPDPGDVKRVLILPDGALGYLPFELLPEKGSDIQGEDFRSIPYLLHRYEISYAYSMTQLATAQQLPQIHTGRRYVGVAPSYKSTGLVSETRNLGQLSENREEVIEAARLWQGSAFTDSAYDNRWLARLSPQPQILHLAMHAIADNQQPLRSRLVMGEQMIYAQDIYALRLPVQLAVLSACETGDGPLLRSEGVMSLGHAFTYAGCPAVLTSLWRADDAASHELVMRFFKHLKAGERKSEALRMAKLEYLAEADPAGSLPLRWANFILIGDTDPLPANDGTGWVWVALTLVGMTAIWALIRRRWPAAPVANG